MKNLITLFPENFAETLGATFMHSIWQLSIVCVVFLFIRMLIPGHRTRLRYNLGLLTMALMVALPVITWNTQSKVISTVVTIEESAGFNAHFSQGIHENLTMTESVPTWESMLDSTTDFFRGYGQILTLLWVLGAVIFAARTAGGFWYLRKLRNQWSVPANADLLEMMDRFSEKLNLKKPVGLMESAKITSPMVIGALQPIILMPAGMSLGLSTQELEYILAHELAHILRRDFLVNVFQTIAEILLFFHPAIWVVSKIVREERENCVDSKVVTMMGNKKEYAYALLNLENLRTNPQLVQAANGGQLIKRVKRIMGVKERKPAWSAGIVTGLFAVLIAITLITGLGEKVKATVFNHPDDEMEEPIDPQGNTKIATTVNSKDVADKKWTLKSVEQVIDTPKIVITLLENGREVKLTMDETGEIMSVTDNGRQIPETEYDQYQQMASTYFEKYAPAMPDPVAPPLPPGSPMGVFGSAMGDMFTGLGEMLAEMPIFDGDGEFTRHMQKLAENVEKMTMEVGPDGEPDPEKMKAFEEEMEKWGKEFEIGFGKDMEAWGEKMEKWGEQFEKDFESKFNEEEMEAWGEEFGRKIEASIKEKDWEKFGESMEKWGEEFGRKMEAHAAQMEAEAEKNQISSALRTIENDMMSDDLIESKQNYKLRINEKGMWVNGKKVPENIHRRYLNKLEDLLDERIDSKNEFNVTKNMK